MVVQAATVIDEYLRTMEEGGRGLPRAEIARAVDVLFGCWQREGTVFTAGNGGSASTATHLACDLAKATIVPGRRRLKTVCLVDNIPLNSAWANDSGLASRAAVAPARQRGAGFIGLVDSLTEVPQYLKLYGG